MAERNISNYTRPRYIESAYSSNVYVGILKTPSLTLNNTALTTTGLLSWSNVDSSTNFYELWLSYNGGAYALYNNNIFYPATTYQLPLNLANGTYKFKIRAGAVITDPDTNITVSYYSAFSNETDTFTVSTLSTPSLQDIAGTSQYYWAAVTNAEYYSLIITKNNATTTTTTILPADIPTAGNPYIINYNDQGTYTISVIAYHSNNFLYHNSATSNIKTYSVIKLATPVLDEDEFTADPPTITWSAITNANAYKIYLNNVMVKGNATGTSYDYSNDVAALTDVYDFAGKIKATYITAVTYPNPKYLDSEFSNTIIWGVLPDPVIALNTTPGIDNRVMITNYLDLTNAEYLEIYDGDNLMDTMMVGPYYELLSDVPKSFNIKIKAVSNDPYITDSDYSNSVTYQIIRLATPYINNTADPDSPALNLSWNTVTNADYYEIYLNSDLVTSTTATSYIFPLITGENNIFIIAKSNYYRYLDSAKSNIIFKIKDPVSQYQIKINNVIYEAALPFVFVATLDETMDTAIISTVPLTISAPFEAYEDVDIIAANLDDGQYKIIPGFPKHMILSQDEVEEINIGSVSKYIHHLNLIERTKLLETELMPDFSITQPMDYAVAVNTADSFLLEPNDNDYTVFADSQPKQLIYYAVPYNVGASYGYNQIYCHGLTNRGLLSNLYNRYSKSEEEIMLPYERASEIRFSGTRNYLIPAGGRGAEPKTDPIAFTSRDLGISIQKRYKYRTHSTEYGVDPNHPETEIGTYTDSVQHSWDISNLPVESYDVILEVYITNDDYTKLLNKLNTYGGSNMSVWKPTSKIELMYQGTSIPTSGSTSNNSFWNNMGLYRIVWPNIVISNAYQYDTSNLIQFESKSIKDAIDKALNIVKPLGVRTYKEPKYTLDPRFNYLGNYTEKPDSNGERKKINEYPCPELKFQNQKSLYEILSEIGRLFYGIPRLGCYDSNNIWQPNMITFDVLDQSTIDAANNKEFIDQNTLETTKSTIDNHNTGFISDLSNIINTNYFAIFPAGSLWTTPRSGAEADPMANKDNMALVLDRPIYKIVDILVRNFDPNNTERYVSIKNFVNEASIYQSLNNDAYGKGLSLFYSQGSNKIEGLGQIPQNTNIQAALGLTADDYIISVILEYASGDIARNTINARANNLEYKVLYIPYVDAKVYTEQANIAGLKNQNYKALNQENNIITDSAFGKSAQTQVERLGNNTIEKSYITKDLNDMPKLGTIKEFDGYKYYADTVTYRFNNNSFEGTASYSKNFNKINERVGIDAMYRLYRIYADDFIDRSININRYCYLSKNEYPEARIDTFAHNNGILIDNIKNALNNGSNITNPAIKPDSMYVRPVSAENTRLQYNTYDGSLADVPAVLLPVNYNVYGNSIAFNAEMKDNFSAGITTAKYNSSTGSYEADVYNGQRIQHDARYVDTNGELSSIYLTIFKYNDDAILGVTPDMYPIANYITSSADTLNNVIYSELIKADKDNRERLKFNYQLHFVTYDKNLTIHPGLTSRLYKNDRTYTTVQEANNVASPAYVLFKNDISKMSNIGNTIRTATVTPSISKVGLGYRLKISTATITADRDYDGYALIWPNSGEIIYSYRQAISAGSYTIPELYLNFADNKIKYKAS